MPHEKLLVKIPQYEAGYDLVSPEAGVRQCANCRWFGHRGENYVSTCRVIEEYPLPIEITGLCNRHEPIPEEALPRPP